MSSVAGVRDQDLREIEGPSALGGGTRHFFDLLWLTAKTQFKLGYHGTVLGFFWSLVRPLMLFAILLVVFTQVFRLGTAVPHYAALLLLNVMLFGLFQESTISAVQSVVTNEALVRKTKFPRLVIPLAGRAHGHDAVRAQHGRRVPDHHRDRRRVRSGPGSCSRC